MVRVLNNAKLFDDTKKVDRLRETVYMNNSVIKTNDFDEVNLINNTEDKAQIVDVIFELNILNVT